jgi:hypothetical protein
MMPFYMLVAVDGPKRTIELPNNVYNFFNLGLFFFNLENFLIFCCLLTFSEIFLQFLPFYFCVA